MSPYPESFLFQYIVSAPLNGSRATESNNGHDSFPETYYGISPTPYFVSE